MDARGVRTEAATKSTNEIWSLGQPQLHPSDITLEQNSQLALHFFFISPFNCSCSCWMQVSSDTLSFLQPQECIQSDRRPIGARPLPTNEKYNCVGDPMTTTTTFLRLWISHMVIHLRCPPTATAAVNNPPISAVTQIHLPHHCPTATTHLSACKTAGCT